MEAKKILKTGDVVELRNGDMFITIRNMENIEDYAFNPINMEHIDIENRDNDLNSIYNHDMYDIVKIYRPLYVHSLKHFTNKSLTDKYFKLIWKKNGIKIGDKVEVINNGLAYTTYTKFLQDYPELLGRYVYGEPVPMDGTYEVVHIGNHLECNSRKLCCIQNSLKQIFIIEEKGVKKI